MTDLTAPLELTDKQAEVLDVIRQFTRRRGYPPTVREIGERVGLTSSSTVHAHLKALIRKGYLHRDPTKPRALIITGEPMGCERCLDLELDNEGQSKLIDSYKRVAVMSRRGYVLDEREVDTPDGPRMRDVWVKWSERGRDAVDVQTAGSFDRDVVGEIHRTYEAGRRV